MTQSIETKPGNNVERSILRRAGGMQSKLFEIDLDLPPENVARHEEVWSRDVAFLFPGEERVRYHTYNGQLFIKSFPNKKVRWSKPIDLENGIRMTNRVKEAYDPKTGLEIEKTKKAIDVVRDLSLGFQKPGITRLDIQLMAEEAATRLADAGFINAKKEEKLEVVKKIVKASQIDSRQRINPARSRLILSHAWVDLIHELLVGNVIEGKYSNIGAKLIREREFERFVLSQVTSRIDELLESPSVFEDRRNIAELKSFVARYLGREVVKLKPYSSVAAISRFLIMNTGTREEFELLKEYIGENADLYYGTKPFTSLNAGERTARLMGVRNKIIEELEIGELFLNTKTSERDAALEEYRRGKSKVT